MKMVTNLIVGFAVSLFGSLPLGYINVIALQIFRTQGLSELLSFLTGVITVEFLLILLILKGARWLIRQEKLLRFTEFVSIGSMLFLAISFYRQPGASVQAFALQQNFVPKYSPLILGLTLNAINLVQITFWTGWNIYLVNAGYIHIEGIRKYAYITGTSLGTFGGVVLFVMLFDFLLTLTGSVSFVRLILPSMCLLLALAQGAKSYRKNTVLK